MDVREKLVELLRKDPHLDVVKGYKGNDCTFEQSADWLIANGVTVQEWVSVDDGLPEEDERVIVWVGNNQYNDVRKDTDKVHNGKWVRWGGCVTHWTTWNVSQPTKGEQRND